ncbi:hypothetical protein EV193_109154 [Herbihabitans rhizosphaerae]|uniref:Uncharacterized protein n=1 Tax=Herbihabitans rhizosphaerae TaxID=1872711 RepID=A0A4V2ERX3_9PSEU|nr:hypothetical protein [Herbihabitans rhizosphaerae]RZS34367.1 hypothetical protein EV193_109154 [Herbihabitans rhizosphaerae]
MDKLRLTKLAGTCEDFDTCPTIYVSDRATLVFQGPEVGDLDGLRLGDGEAAIALSIDLVKEAIRAYDAR